MPKKVVKKPPYPYNGQVYTTKVKLSEATEINRKTLTRLLEENPTLTVDEIVAKYKEGQITYEYGEKKYSSKTEAADDIGLNKNTLSKYLKLANNNLKKAMKLYEEEHTYTIMDGVRYASQEELAKSINTTVVTLKKYIDSEGSIKAAVKAIKKPKSTYNWKGVEYKSLESVSIAMEIPRQTLTRIMENETNGDVEKAYDIYQERNKRKYSYKRENLEFDTIDSLASYLGKGKTTVAKYLKKYDGNVDKAIFMMKIRDLRRQKVAHENSQVSTQDMAIILGIKQNELIAYLNSGMTIDEIKESVNATSKSIYPKTQLEPKASTIMYDSNTNLAQFCLEHRINYNCIYYAITTYGKSKEEALEHYYQHGQRIPKAWIYQKYDVLLKHLLLNEGMNSDKIVAEMRNKVISLKEAIENYIIKEEAKELNLDSDWQIELYSILTAEHIPEEEKEEFKKEFYVTETEEQGINKAQNRINKIERKLLLYEMAECIKGNIYPENEMVALMKEYEISEEEIDTIFLDLYANFDKGVRIADGQELAQERKVLNNYVRNWEVADEQQKRELKQENYHTWQWVENLSAKIAFYKIGTRLKKLTGQDIGMAGHTANVEQCTMAEEALENAMENTREGDLKNGNEI